ncbi:PIN domain-containing protein [Candidatus Leptofilum sp.]|uniref:PIN domain-containing protein n=1 Tax=Candidatus Leptofilum sp. TaxID=3241576 RepID=UPI003B5CBA0C
MPVEPASLCFVDSNLWLYAMLPQDDQSKETLAKQLITDNHDNIVISTQVINEITNNLLRKGNFTEHAIRNTIRSLYDDFQVIPMSQAIQERASELREKYSLSHYDGLIVAAALLSSATILYSEDMHDSLVIENQLPIVNPFN